MKRIRCLLLGLVATVAVCGAACAQGDYPNQMVRIIVPFSAGSITDNLARILADKLG
jgi:tripartite-type tricarboxylate transporter receptor subunit TctC